MYESCAIYYFSATGNSLAVALELSQKLRCAEPISIPGSLVLDDPYAAARSAAQVGFVFPVHRASLPEMVRGFIEQMPKRRDCYYFAISTYTVFGCNEFWDIDEILTNGGSFLNYASEVKTMGNVGFIDPNSKLMTRRLQSISAQVEEIAEAIGNFQENYFRRASRALRQLVRAYTNQRRNSIVFRVDQRCKKCGICAQVCPAKNIIFGGEDGPAPTRSDKCEVCYACIHWCPANAIATMTRLHSHYHHPHIRPEQLNPLQSDVDACGAEIRSGSEGACDAPAGTVELCGADAVDADSENASAVGA